MWCIFCDNDVRGYLCPTCGEYKGLMARPDALRYDDDIKRYRAWYAGEVTR